MGLNGIPHSPVISGNIVRTLGWLQLPGLLYLYGDSAWQILGHKLNKLYYCSDVIIEHKHYFSRKVEADSIFFRTNNQKVKDNDHDIMVKWVQNDLQKDLEKIRGVMCK